MVLVDYSILLDPGIQWMLVLSKGYMEIALESVWVLEIV